MRPPPPLVNDSPNGVTPISASRVRLRTMTSAPVSNRNHVGAVPFTRAWTMTCSVSKSKGTDTVESPVV